MPSHEYIPQDALRLLIAKIAARDAGLASQVLAAVNAGRDVQEVEPRGKRKARFYRRTVPYDPEEALEIALEVLQAHFVEQPRFVNSCHDDMSFAVLGPGASPSSMFEPMKFKATRDFVRAEKMIEIELQTATEIIPTETALQQQSQEVAVLPRLPVEQIHEQEENLNRLRRALDFTK